jgi:cephalosporin hydroxylase
VSISLMDPAALVALSHLASEVKPGQAIVELGVYRGGSLAVLSENAPEGVTVVGIDPWGLPGVGSRYNRLRKRYSVENMEIASQAAPKARLLRNFSTVVAKVWSRPVGLLLVDALHTYEAVKADWQAWEGHMAQGSVVVFDDYWPGRFDGVVQAVDEIFGDRVNLLAPRTAFVRL